MAAYNYYGQNYGNPYLGYPMVYQAPMQQPQMAQNVPQVQQPQQQQVQTYSPAINQSGIIWISGMQEAQMYPIAPNNAVALWQKDGKTIYLKQADATGRPTLTVYDLVERKENTSDGTYEQGDKQALYATKEELRTVVGAVKGFDELIGSLKSDIDSMKSDMYGIAGKKKPVKKVEVNDDDA